MRKKDRSQVNLQDTSRLAVWPAGILNATLRFAKLFATCFTVATSTYFDVEDALAVHGFLAGVDKVGAGHQRLALRKLEGHALRNWRRAGAVAFTAIGSQKRDAQRVIAGAIARGADGL